MSAYGSGYGGLLDFGRGYEGRGGYMGYSLVPSFGPGYGDFTGYGTSLGYGSGYGPGGAIGYSPFPGIPFGYGSVGYGPLPGIRRLGGLGYKRLYGGHIG